MQKTATIVLIGAFYFIIVVFSVVFLATAQLRSSGGSAFDTWRLSYDANREINGDHRARLSKLRADLIQMKDGQNYTDKCLRIYDESGKFKVNMDEETLKLVRTAKSSTTGYGDLPFGEAQCVFRGFTMLQWDKDYYENVIRDYEREILEVEALLKSDDSKMNDLIKGHEEFMALYAMENKWYTILFVIIPYDLLVLFLVVSMGLLGGIIRILRDYGTAGINNPPTKDYFLLPLIGAVVAIGGYILAKTGLLLLSSGKGDTSLSPFMVGLVGMISGLLAKEVIDRISAYGHDILKETDKGEAPGGDQDQTLRQGKN
jgi:hypothetical protein